VHGVQGYNVDHDNYIAPCSIEGDFLITQQKNIGLGVLTADCLPIMMVDSVTRAVGIAHAGWRGSVQKIALAMFESMQRSFGSKASDVQVFFGPCIKKCCYEVQDDFVDKIVAAGFNDALYFRSERIYCDLVSLNTGLLKAAGFSEKSFNFDFNVCTLCDKNYYSYRRNGHSIGRNVSIIFSYL